MLHSRTIPFGLPAILLAASLSTAHAGGFPIFTGDPIDPSTGRAIEALPGAVFFLPQPDGRFHPPIVDLTRRGDVDLVVRARGGFVGATMPPPVTIPPVGVAGGAGVGGAEIPFTVIASDGSAGGAGGRPLVGPEMDGLPVIVSAFADLDGDGVIGPTDADAGGTLDNGREAQELYVVGRQLAVFINGVAQGTLACWKGAPASAGGLSVVLTATAYVGFFDPAFMFGNVPDGPGVSTALPFFPDLNPLRVVEGRGAGGPAGPGVRFNVEIVPAFDPPVSDPVLGTPFALPTDGSSVTVDRAQSTGGPYSRARFVRPSELAEFPEDVEVPIYRGAGGQLFQELRSVNLADDGPGRGLKTVRLVPADLYDNITDPPAGTTVTLVVSPGLRIAAPDTDGSPTRETIVIDSAAGVDVVLDDLGRANDGPPSGILAVTEAGVPTEALAVTLTPVVGAGGGGGGGGSGGPG